MRGNIEGGGGEVQIPVPKTGYKDAGYNTGNIANIYIFKL